MAREVMPSIRFDSGRALMKICKCCKHVFKPRLADAEFVQLFYTNEEIEQNEFLMNEYPGRVDALEAPTQILCEECSLNPNLRWKKSMFNEPQPYIEIEVPKGDLSKWKESKWFLGGIGDKLTGSDEEKEEDDNEQIT